MLKAKNLSEINAITNPVLRSYICKRATALMEEYGADSLEEIGYFVVLEKSENQMFAAPDMEFVEVLKIGEEMFLHGARILGDSYGEDIYIPVEVIEA